VSAEAGLALAVIALSAPHLVSLGGVAPWFVAAAALALPRSPSLRGPWGTGDRPRAAAAVVSVAALQGVALAPVVAPVHAPAALGAWIWPWLLAALWLRPFVLPSPGRPSRRAGAMVLAVAAAAAAAQLVRADVVGAPWTGLAPQWGAWTTWIGPALLVGLSAPWSGLAPSAPTTGSPAGTDASPGLTALGLGAIGLIAALQLEVLPRPDLSLPLALVTFAALPWAQAQVEGVGAHDLDRRALAALGAVVALTVTLVAPVAGGWWLQGVVPLLGAGAALDAARQAKGAARVARLTTALAWIVALVGTPLSIPRALPDALWAAGLLSAWVWAAGLWTLRHAGGWARRSRGGPDVVAR
jgi:hypothetical protein